MEICSTLFWIFAYITGFFGVVSFATYFVMLIVQQILMRIPNNLKNKYKAEWALVTGASSGIGKCLTEKLAEQGINVVMAARDDADLAKSFAELEGKYKNVRFRKVPVDLGDAGASYMKPILDATEDITVTLIFCNAGYILPGMIPDTPWERVRANIECNAVSATAITHHFTRKLIEKKLRGLVTFTSSAAGYLPGPTATTYSCTKAFVTNYAASIACDLRDVGIDVLVMHPSPVNTNFYRGTLEQMAALASAQKMAVGPMVIADQIFAGAGRITVWDQGPTCAIFRVVNKLLDQAFFWELMARVGYLASDHPKMARESTLRNPKKI